MQARTASLAVFLFLCLALIGEAAYYLPILPERLVTQFDFSGSPNRWSNKADFIIGLASLLAFLGANFGAAGPICRFVTRFYGGIIMLPNKKYWLAPERREDTLAYLRDWFRWLQVLLLALATLAAGLALRANLFDPPKMPDTAIWLFPAYLIPIVAMFAVLARRFYSIKPSSFATGLRPFGNRSARRTAASISAATGDHPSPPSDPTGL